MDKIGKVSERPFGRSLISFILILTILLGFLPTTAFAAETMTVSDPDALEQIGTITIEGNDYNLYRLVVDTVQYNAIEFSDASSCAITTVVPVMGKKPAAIGATNLINVAPDSENYSKGEALYQSSISSNLSEEILDGLRTDTDKLGYYLYAVKRGKINTIIGVLILEWPEASQEVEGANKDELQRVIARAGLISSSDYYQAEDYYNGKTTSSDGFWQDFQTALKTAKEILDNITATQEDVNGATASLNAAIANLIPANQVNATVLYEAIQEVESRGYRGGAVKLKEDRIGARLYHRDPRPRGARHRGPGQAEGGLGRLSGGTVQVGSHPHIVAPVNPRREAIAVLCRGGRCLLKGGVGLGELEMVTPHGDVGGLAVVIAGMMNRVTYLTGQ